MLALKHPSKQHDSLILQLLISSINRRSFGQGISATATALLAVSQEYFQFLGLHLNSTRAAILNILVATSSVHRKLFAEFVVPGVIVPLTDSLNFVFIESGR